VEHVAHQAILSECNDHSRKRKQKIKQQNKVGLPKRMDTKNGHRVLIILGCLTTIGKGKSPEVQQRKLNIGEGRTSGVSS
jgi:ribosomal protein L34